MLKPTTKTKAKKPLTLDQREAKAIEALENAAQYAGLAFELASFASAGLKKIRGKRKGWES